ncbi:MAG: Polyketide cyclase/dehydrase [Actinomycetia bacterium]|nr:Polyketide cyclase/dehydrase [Actinomycetes bacterium]
MARNDLIIRARPSDVFAVLSDPDSYGEWVVGSKRIRDHDRRWPKPGSRFHHTVGVGPLTVKDNSKVLELERDKRLVLEARVRPFGTATVDLRLKPVRRGKATKVTMREEARGGRLRRTWNPVFDAATHARNAVALRRLKRMVEARSGE